MIELENKFMKLTEEELKKQQDSIWSFLQLIHPELKNFKYVNQLEGTCQLNDLAIELRALKRIKGNKNASYMNHRIYNYGEKQRILFDKFLKKLNDKEIPFCLYYSAYNFNSTIMGCAESKGSKPKEAWNNCVCKNNAIATHMLPMDFDDMSEEEFIKYRTILAKIGIDTTDIFTGHGYQSLIKLDKLCLDKKIITTFTNKLLSKGFRVDNNIKDCARLLRPYETINAKGILKDLPQVKSELLYETDKIYTLEEVFSKLDELPTVKEIKEKDDSKKNKKEETKSKESEKIKEVKLKEVNEITSNKKDEIPKLIKTRLSDSELQTIYPMLTIEELHNPVKLMLSGFQPKRANKMLLFLVRYFKALEYPKPTIYEIVDKLKDLNTYNYAWGDLYVEDIKRFYGMDNYTPIGVYVGFGFDKEFGYLGDVTYIFENKEIIEIENYLFNNLNKISSQAFCCYIKLLQYQHNNNKTVYTMKEMSEVTGVSVRRLKQHIDKLIDIKVIDKKRTYRKNKEEYMYFISKIQRNRALGYTKFNINLLWRLLKMCEFKEINQTELMICMFLKYKCYTSEYKCCLSQETIAENLGVAQSTISRGFNNIEKSQLVKRTKETISDFQFKYYYDINF